MTSDLYRIFSYVVNSSSVPVAARSKAWVCGRSLAGIVGSNPAGSMDIYLSVVSVVCCQVEVSSTGRSLVQRSPTDYVAKLCVIVNPPK